MIEYILISAPNAVQLNVREDLKAAVREGNRIRSNRPEEEGVLGLNLDIEEKH